MISGSLAVTWKLIVAPWLTVLLPIGVRTGGRLTSSILSCTVWLDEAEPSLTVNVTLYVPAPCVSSGVQLNRPVEALIDAPGMLGDIEYVRTLAGRSASVVRLAMLNRICACSGYEELTGGAERTGGLFTSLT